MDAKLVIRFRETTVELWTQNPTGRPVPFVYNGSNELPLYFFVENDHLVMGAFAKDRYLAGSSGSYGDYYKNIVSSDATFERFHMREPVRKLLFLILKENILPDFIRHHAGSGQTFENYLRTCQITLFFDYSLSEDVLETLTTTFIEVIGIAPRNVITVSYWELFYRSLARQVPDIGSRPVVALFAADNDLHFCLVASDAPFIMSRRKVLGRGANPGLDQVAELIAERAIKNGGSMLTLAQAKREVLPFADTFLSQLQTGIIEGTVKLSDTGIVYIQFMALQLQTRLDNRASLNLIQSQFDDFRSASRAVDAPIFLLGEVLNSDNYVQFFRDTYNKVYPQPAEYDLLLVAESLCIAQNLSKEHAHVPIEPVAPVSPLPPTSTVRTAPSKPPVPPVGSDKVPPPRIKAMPEPPSLPPVPAPPKPPATKKGGVVQPPLPPPVPRKK